MTQTISSRSSLFKVSQNSTNFLLTKKCLGTSLLQLEDFISPDDCLRLFNIARKIEMNTKCTNMHTQRGLFRFKIMTNEAKGLCGTLVLYVCRSVNFLPMAVTK